MTSADAAEAGAPGAAALGSPPGSRYGSGKWHAKACGAPSSGGRSTRRISCTFGQRVENGHPVAAAEAMPCIVRVRCARRRSPGIEAASGGRAWGGCHVLKSRLPGGNGGAFYCEYVIPRGRPGD